MHERENAVVVGRCRKDQSVIAESVLDGLGHVISRQIADSDLDALGAQHLSQLLDSRLCVAVDGCVCDADAGLLRCIGGPLVIQVDIVAEVLAQHGTVQRADDLNVEALRRLEDLLCLKAVFSYDAKIVSARFAGPSFGIFHVVGTELAEAVRGEEDLVRAVICEHDLRPVDHGSKHKFQDMLAKAQLLAVPHDLLLHGVILSVELLHEGKSLGVSDHGRVGIDLEEALNISGVVGLHVLHYQIIRLSVAQNRRQVGKPLLAEVLIDRIHDDDLFVHDHIGIVGHSERHFILSLEKIDLMVIDADILDIFCNSHIALLY